MRKNIRLLCAVALTALSLAACGGGGDSGDGSKGAQTGNETPFLMVDDDGVSSFDGATLEKAIAQLPVESLSTAEKDSLAYLREEEKLAHDVYILMDSLWGVTMPIFENIAAGEASHTEAVRTLLVRYDLPDPALNLGAGVFINTTLQALYTQLAATGSGSLVAALQVGAEIEELDIIDIQNALLLIDNQDIRMVYENLLKGSRNHLRSFVKTLVRQGVTYQPKYLSSDGYNAIIDTPIERRNQRNS